MENMNEVIFQKGLGYKREDVDKFASKVTCEIENLEKDNEELTKKLEEVSKKCDELEKLNASIKVSKCKNCSSVEQLIEASKKVAEKIVGKAKDDAALIAMNTDKKQADMTVLLKSADRKATEIVNEAKQEANLILNEAKNDFIKAKDIYESILESSQIARGHLHSMSKGAEQIEQFATLKIDAIDQKEEELLAQSNVAISMHEYAEKQTG